MVMITMDDPNAPKHWWSAGMINNATKTQARMICQADSHSLAKSSYRVLNSPLSLLLVEQPLLFVTTHTIHFFLRRLGQNLLVSQILAGILLGPSLMVNPKTLKKLIPPVALYTLQTISRFGFILYLFLVGVKTDMSVLKRTGSTAVILAFSGFFFSTLFGFVTYHFIAENLLASSSKTAPQLIILNSISFFIVTSQQLLNLEISNTELGRLASCVALVLDSFAMFMDTFVLKFFLLEMNYFREGSKFESIPFKNLLCFFLFYTVMFFGCRPLMILIIKRTPVGTRMKRSHLMLILLIFFATVFVAECINQPVSPYLLGLSLPNAPFGAILADKLEGIINGLFLPILCSVTGLRANFRRLTRKSIWLELVFLVCYVGKVIGTIVASMLFKLSFMDALALALIVCSKGLVEIATLLLWRDERIVNNEQFTVGLIHILLVTNLAVPLVRRLYDPAKGYKATYNRRTLQESFESNNLKILVCIYGEDNITSIINLLEASKPLKCTTFSIIALHLVNLTGHLMPFREPLHLVHKSVVNQILSENTLNAIQSMERRSHGYSRVQHYLATAPYKTMYNDICSMAFEMRITFIIVPFHKRWNINQKQAESCFTPIKEVNKRVLEEAPCVVGVLVDKSKMTDKFFVPNMGSSRRSSVSVSSVTSSSNNNAYTCYYHVAMLFIGGPDDQEALAYCRLLANNPRMRLTIVWMREKYDATKIEFGVQDEDQDDMKFLREFQYNVKENERVSFVEEYVSDGTETTKAVFKLGEVDLVVIGRWHDPYTPVTAGLTEWSNSTDQLGALGDVLAGPDFSFSMLVIQQQPMITWIAE